MEAAEPIIDRRRIRRVSDERILSAAAAEFAEHGFDRASMASIAARAQTSKPTLYANFGTKEELHAAVLRHEAQAFRDTLLATYAQAADAGAREQLRRGTQAVFDLARNRPDGFRLLFAADRTATAGSEFVAQAMHDVDNAVTGLVGANLARSGSPNPRGAQFIATLVVALIRAAAQTAMERDLNLEAASVIAQELAHEGLSRMKTHALGEL